MALWFNSTAKSLGAPNPLNPFPSGQMELVSLFLKVAGFDRPLTQSSDPSSIPCELGRLRHSPLARRQQSDPL
jgi:hypothetical protein